MPLKALLQGKREVNLDTSIVNQAGDDDYHSSVFKYIVLDRDTSNVVLDDTNTIFISNSAGLDTNNGTESLPFKTVSKAIQTATNDNDSRFPNIYYFCFLASSYNYVNSAGETVPDKISLYNDTSVSSTYKILNRTIYANNDTDTVWIDPVSGDDTTGNGNRLLPYKTIQKGLSIITNTRNQLAILTDSTNKEITENFYFFDTAAVASGNIYLNAYSTNDGIDTVPGNALSINFDKSQDIRTLTALSNYNVEKSDYLISQNFLSGEAVIYWCNSGRSAGVIEYSILTQNIVSEYTTSIARDWRNIVEYEYNGSWYLLVFAVSGGNLYVFWRKDDGTTGETIIPLTYTTTNTIIDVVSDGEIVLIALTENDGTTDYFSILHLTKELNPATIANYTYLLDPQIYTTETFRLKLLYQNNFAFFSTNTTDYFYLYNGSEITAYKFSNIYHEICYLDEKIYGFENKNSVVNIYRLDFDEIFGIFITTIASNSTVYALIENYGVVYFWLEGLDQWYSFDKISVSQISNLTASYNLNINGDATVYLGLIPMFINTATQNFLFIQNAIASIHKIGVYLNGFVYKNQCGGGIGCEGATIPVSWSRFQDCKYGIKGRSFDIELSAFINTDYCIVFTRASSNSGVNIFHNFITAYRFENAILTSNFTITSITADLGTNLIEAINSTINTTKYALVVGSILSRVANIANTTTELPVYFDENLIQIPFRSGNALFYDPTGSDTTDTNIYDTPIFTNRDAIGLEFPDFRLQRRWIRSGNSYYKFISPGVDGFVPFGISSDMGVYSFQRLFINELYHYDWETDFEPAEDDKGFVYPNVAATTSVNGSRFFTKNGSQPRLTLFWLPDTREQKETLKDLFTILARDDKKRLTYNPWYDLTDAELEAKALVNDAGVESGPSVVGSGTVKARFNPVDMSFWQTEKTWYDNEWAGWLLYISYTAGAARRGFFAKVLTNTSDTMILKDVDELPDKLPDDIIDNVSDDLIYVMGSIDVTSNVSELQTKFDQWYDKAASSMGYLHIELLGQ
jgi:hypothetical protein